MKIAIVGSRDYPNWKQVVDYVAVLPEDTEVVSGHARGVDSIAESAARRRHLKVTVFRANWRIGNHAGFLRNRQIVDYADRIVAFWDGSSKGTAHSIQLARQAHKPLEIHYSDGRIEESP